MQKKMNLGGILGQAQKMATGENTQGNGDPIEDKIKGEKLKLQMLQDSKKLGKKEFAAKYSAITDEDKKLIGYGKGYTIEDITKDIKDGTVAWGDEQSISTSIPKLEKDYESKKAVKLQQEETQKAEKLKQDQLFNTSKTDIDNYNKLKSNIKEKYKYDIDQKPVDFRQAYNEGITKEANERIKTKNDVKVPGNPDAKNTCIAGTCTLASNQGVDFSKMSGNVDAQGRKIPINNQSFYNELANSGYEEIPYEQRAPGDFVQFDEASGKKDHMEILLDKNAKTGVDRNFNNYSLSNYKTEDFDTPGESFRKLVKKPDGTIEAINTEAGFKPFPNSRVLRIKDETAKAAYLKLHPEYAQQLEGQKSFESSEDFKNYTAANEKIEALKTSNPDLYKRLTTTATETTTNAKK